MGLTSTTFLVLLAAVTMAFFLATVMLMPRLVSGPVRLVGRVCLLLLLNALVLLLAAVLLNNQYGFYASWSDLLGSGTLHGTTSSRGGSVRATLRHPVAGPGFAQFARPAGGLPPMPQAEGRSQTYQVTGSRSHLSGQIRVYLPVSYLSPAASRRTYPVIIGLHGYPTQPVLWFSGMHVDQHVDAAVAGRAMSEAIVVLPQSNIPLASDTECVDGRSGQPQMETWLARDVPQWILEHFRVRPDRRSWAVAGYSAGGWCAAMIALRHPDLFGAGIVLSGYFRPDFTDAYRPYRPGDPGWERYDLVELAHRAPPPLALWIQTGEPSRFDRVLKEFLAAVRAPTSVTLLDQPNAGHRIDVWSSDLPAALAWLGAGMPGFGPANGTA